MNRKFPDFEEWIREFPSCNRCTNEQILPGGAAKEKLRDILDPNGYSNLSEEKKKAWTDFLNKNEILDMGIEHMPRIKEKILWIRFSSLILNNWEMIYYFWKYPDNLI